MERTHHIHPAHHVEREDLESWFARHPESIHAQPGVLLDRCESEVRHHAQQDAWLHARDVAESSLHRFERVFGLPASDRFVTREVCHEIARELKNNEPHPDEQATASWVSQTLLDALDGEARNMLRAWLKDLAEKEEHEAWRSIVYFTDHMARALIRDEHMTNDLDWDFDRSYPRVAVRVARLLIREFELHAAAMDDGGPALRIARQRH